jgi:hypothetical protein
MGHCPNIIIFKKVCQAFFEVSEIAQNSLITRLPAGRQGL